MVDKADRGQTRQLGSGGEELHSPCSPLASNAGKTCCAINAFANFGPEAHLLYSQWFGCSAVEFTDLDPFVTPKAHFQPCASEPSMWTILRSAIYEFLNLFQIISPFPPS